MRPLSARNPRVQRLGRLARRRGERVEQRALLVEGPVLVGTALDAGAEVLELYVDEAALADPEVTALVQRLDEMADVWMLPPGVLDRVGDAATSQGVAAVVQWDDGRWPTPDRVPFVLVLADVADPGNAGTLIRTAVAAGVGAVVVAGGVDPTSPKVVRSSAGALFSVDVVRADSAAEAASRLADDGYLTVGTVVDGADAYDTVDLTGPVAVVLGNEAHGLASEVAADLGHLVTIPMAGPTESLNVAMAGTVVCFEVLRQRR
ncbi:MAG: RNA methyltransferase [Aquihabitans sp.]